MNKEFFSYGATLDEYDLILREELNVKDIEYLSDTKSLCTPYLVLDFKVAGMTYKDKVNHVKDLLVNLNDSEMSDLYNKYCNHDKLVLDDMELSYDTLKVEYRYNSGIKGVMDSNKFVGLDVTIDDELYEESIDDLNNLKHLDFQKYNYLLNLDINFFLNWTKNHQTYNKLHEREIIIRNKNI